MKGAVGNAFLLNIVITFIGVFFTLLIGSMAYTKTYKVKNYLISSIEIFENTYDASFSRSIINHKSEWRDLVNPYLGGVGYHLSHSKNSCPRKDNYLILKDTSVGDYEYCIYYHQAAMFGDSLSDFEVDKFTYMVLVYMKLDLPIIGSYLKLPITGETKTYVQYK